MLSLFEKRGLDNPSKLLILAVTFISSHPPISPLTAIVADLLSSETNISPFVIVPPLTVRLILGVLEANFVPYSLSSIILLKMDFVILPLEVLLSQLFDHLLLLDLQP